MEDSLVARVGASGNVRVWFVWMPTAWTFVDCVSIKFSQLSVSTAESRNVFCDPYSKHLRLCLHCLAHMFPGDFCKMELIYYLPTLKESSRLFSPPAPVQCSRNWWCHLLTFYPDPHGLLRINGTSSWTMINVGQQAFLGQSVSHYVELLRQWEIGEGYCIIEVAIDMLILDF